MTKSNTANTLPLAEMQESKASSMKLVALEILLGNFASDAERDAFLRAMIVHGVALLRAKDSFIKKIMRSISHLWPRPSDKAVRS